MQGEEFTAKQEVFVFDEQSCAVHDRPGGRFVVGFGSLPCVIFENPPIKLCGHPALPTARR